MLFEGSETARELFNWALDYLPLHIRREWWGKIAFVCPNASDGKRLTRYFRGEREIIVISEHIVPRSFSSEGEPEVRYFIYVVLHEIAHAINDDKAPVEISPEENQKQEERADRLALEWFNTYIDSKRGSGLIRLTPDEVAKTQAQNALVDAI